MAWSANIAVMPFSQTDFADDTDFERFVLDRLGTHRVRPATPTFTYDIRGSHAGRGQIIEQVGGATMARRGVEALGAALRPLGFGAGFKVLDMLIEHVLRANGAIAGRMSFVTKSKRVRSRPSQLPRPLDAFPTLWDRLARLYSDFEEARHAVTHRRASAVSGDLQIYDEPRKLIDTVTACEIAAFAGAVHGLAELVIEGSDDQRRVGMVTWHLNQLSARHGMPLLPATDPQAGRRLLKADLVALGDGRVQLDVADARKAVNSQPGPSLWDLELYTGGSVFVGRWEDLPGPSAATYEFELASAPDWLTEEVATR